MAMLNNQMVVVKHCPFSLMIYSLLLVGGLEHGFYVPQ